jgi:hypothetical protein
MTPEAEASPVAVNARARGVPAPDLGARLEPVLLQRAWKVCGTFARAVSQGRGPVYREYLPAQLRLVTRLLKQRKDAVFGPILRSRVSGLLDDAERAYPPTC